MASFNECITQRDQEELVSIRGGIDTLQWRVGDIVLRNYQDNQEHYSFPYICAAVGFFAGKSRSTIQRWARVAKFYSEEWRNKYAGLLSFEHYAAAMQYPDWEQRLERAAFGGFNEEPQSVDQMNAQSLSREAEEPDTFPVSPTAVVSYDTSVPSVQILGQPENTIQTILGLIGKLADSLGLNEERRAKVYRAMELLSEALCVQDNVQ